METIDVTDEDGETVSVTAEELARQIGTQYITNRSTGASSDDREFAYLAALALECSESDYTVEETLVEFIRNSSASLGSNTGNDLLDAIIEQ